MTTYIIDTECYRDYWLIMFRDIDTCEVFGYDMYPGKELGITSLPDATLISFNGINYDFPIISLALAGADCGTLKSASDSIIVQAFKPWHIRDKFGGIDISSRRHIDLIEIAPGQCGLKAYGGRLHSRKLQDLPIDPSASISPEQRVQLIEYCGNDLRLTEDLWRKLEPQIAMRQAMTDEFGINLMSKSDAQLAEAVIRSQVEKKLGRRIYRPELHPDYQFSYRPPCTVQFLSTGMSHMLHKVKGAVFTISATGSVVMPEWFESLHMVIGEGKYVMGIGGLHSTEKGVSHVADENTLILDDDVRGYYPNLMLTQAVFPPAMGPDFLTVFRDLVDRREVAKAKGDKFVDAGLKTATVSCFGKFGSKWSTLYSPDSLIHVTLTGQLFLLMLIELIESIGIPVISANTDGIVIMCPTMRKDELDAVVSAWEITTGLQMEETRYAAIYAKDVNNYLAIGTDGAIKQKGIYSFVGSKKSELEKNPTNSVCVDAVKDYLKGEKSIESSISACRDIRRFLTCRKVEGGATYDGEYLGKNVRWYYASGESRHVQYASNGNKVARSEGARPMMELPDTLPSDIDTSWYVREAYAILKDIGA